ncbi:hypothetical protein ABPG72_001236 [Tetrahymena utriculariae]
MMQQRLNIFPNTPPHDFSLKTKDIEGARNKFIERKELMERLRQGDQNYMFSQGATNKLQQQQRENELQQLKNDYNQLKQQVDQLSTTIKNSPNVGQQARHSMEVSNNSPYQQVNGMNYNPNRYSGNSENKINVYRNAGNQIINNQSSIMPRNQSQGNISSSMMYENKPRLGSQDMLNRINSPVYNQNIRSENNLNVPQKQFQRYSPQNFDHQNQKQTNYLMNGYNDNQLKNQSIFQMGTLLNRYERHRYVPPQKNEYSRFPSKQVFFY